MNRNFGEANLLAFEGFDFYFFAERHSVAFERHFREDTSAEDPHAALRIADPAKIKQTHGDRKDEVAHFVFETHRFRIAHGEPRRIQKVDLKMTKCLQKIRDGVRRIAMIAVEGDDDVTRRKGEALLVGTSIPASIFANHSGPEIGSHFAGAVGRTVIDNNHLIDKGRHSTQDLLDSLLLVETRHDNGNALVVVHQKRKFQNRMRTLALLVSTTLATMIGFAQGNAELSQVQTIYLMPMANGFDQYLANRLRAVNQIRIVTDASKADAIFTDKIGLAFEARLDEMEAAAKEKIAAAAPPVPGESLPGMKLAPRVVSSIGRGRGTYFLVDRRSRVVLWSSFHKAKDAQPKNMHANAGKVANELAEDFSGKKK